MLLLELSNTLLLNKLSTNYKDLFYFKIKGENVFYFKNNHIYNLRLSVFSVYLNHKWIHCIRHTTRAKILLQNTDFNIQEFIIITTYNMYLFFIYCISFIRGYAINITKYVLFLFKDDFDPIEYNFTYNMYASK